MYVAKQSDELDCMSINILNINWRDIQRLNDVNNV